MKIIKYEEYLKIDDFKKMKIEYGLINPYVKDIIEEVRKDGDKALKKFSKKFDGVNLENLEVSKKEINAAYRAVNKDFLKSLRLSIKNQFIFQKAIFNRKSKIVETSKGVRVWREWRPIEKIGLYIPGGKACYPSSVVMTAVPAKTAGCKEIIICCPPDKNGNIPAAVLVAANEIGVTKLFKVGGAQAIAAMAYGTERIPKVYKIFGAGNRYVTAAKMLVFGQVNIDMPAGPSEIMVIADDSSDAEWVAADLISQCEHASDSSSILVTNSAMLADKVKKYAYLQAEKLPSAETIKKSLQDNSLAVIVKNWRDAINIANEYAPEHLEIITKNYKTLSKKIINAGSIFLGKYSSEPAGDYSTGSNHVLPTNGYAKMFSPLSIDCFGKQVQFQELNQNGLKKIAESVMNFAEAEGLYAHKNAISIRIN